MVRHGETNSNEPGQEKLRGWLPVPLNVVGMKQARERAESFADLAGVDHLYCGTLVRVVQSAEEIAQYLSQALEPDEAFNDWDTGDFAGHPVKETLDDLHSHIKAPLKKVPGGESFQSFLDRIEPKLRKLVESSDINILVSSGRVSTLLKAFSANQGKYPSTDILLGKPPIDPSGIFILDRDWNVLYNSPKDEASKGLS